MTFLKYGLTRIKDANGNWKPLKGLWQKTQDSLTGEIAWTPVKDWYTKAPQDGGWHRIYPTPAGINTANPTSFNFRIYQHWSSGTQQINFSNTGDYPLTISNIVANDGSSTITTLDLTGINGGLPFTMQPGDSGYINFSVKGINIGTSLGNIVFTQDVGYFGTDGNAAYWPGNQTVIPVTSLVLADVAGIVVSPNPIVYNSYVEDPPSSINVRIASGTNSPPYGANLNISNITISGNGSVSNVPTTVGFNFDTYTANTAPFTLTASNLNIGVYNSTITINSNANNNLPGGYITVPVVLNVIKPHGNQVFGTPGTYTWTVPLGVHHITTYAVGGGGGGGGSSYRFGYGSGGGGGGYSTVSVNNFTVTPGQSYSITVGAGGAGGAGDISTAGGGGGRVYGGTGGTSVFSGPAGSLSATGGQGGESGRYDDDGDNDFDEGGEDAGGSAGPGGTSGQHDTANHQGGGFHGANMPGGTGGNNGFVFISGNPPGQPTDQILNATAYGPNIPMYPATNGVYPGFLNAYGVWNVPNAGDWGHNDASFGVAYATYIQTAGNYTVYACCDNACQVTINGIDVVNNANWGTVNSGPIYLTPGNLTINIAAQNWGGPASVAVALADPSGNYVWTTRSINVLVPDSRNIYGRGGNGADAAGASLPGFPGNSGAVIINW